MSLHMQRTPKNMLLTTSLQNIVIKYSKALFKCSMYIYDLHSFGHTPLNG